MHKKYSPITEVPLRSAGDSLLRKRSSILLNEILPPIIIALVLGVFAMLEWLRWFRDMPPHPLFATIVFMIVVLFCGVYMWRGARKLRNYDLGLIGEKHVSEILNDTLPALGYHIIHDIPFDRMNIDHVLIGPAGIFTIETKTVRKMKGEQSTIQHTKSSVCLNGHKNKWFDKAVRQAQQEAVCLKEILISDGTHCPHIQAIVLYPEWYVEDDCKKEVWVLNENYFVKKIRSLPQFLSSETIEALRKRIEAYARERTNIEDYRS